MFTIDKTVVVDKKLDWTPDEKVNGMRFASITKHYDDKYQGAALVAMYLESFRYKLKNCEQLSSDIITSKIYDESNTVGSMMQNVISNNLIKNCSIHYCNDILTLKWFMHEYKQCLVELKHTTATELPVDFDISTGGFEIDDGKSIGYMVYGYDSEYVMLQGVNGVESGFGGFYRMKWDLFQSLFIQGSVFGLKKQKIEWLGLKFTAEEAGSTVYMCKVGSTIPEVQLMYSLDDGGTWNDLTICSYLTTLDGTIITLNAVGDSVCFKASSTNQVMGFSGLTNHNRFGMTGKISASGNVMSLLDGSNYISMNSLEGRTYALAGLFLGCTSLTQAPELPATTLAYCCYDHMFSSCDSLVQAPELPATTLATGCYCGMFQGCTSLTQAPELPATTLVSDCYQLMFSGCTSLKEIKLGYFGSFQKTYFQNWVYSIYGMSSTGTLLYNGSDTTRGPNAIPNGWNVKSYYNRNSYIETDGVASYMDLGFEPSANCTYEIDFRFSDAKNSETLMGTVNSSDVARFRVFANVTTTTKLQFSSPTTTDVQGFTLSPERHLLKYDTVEFGLDGDKISVYSKPNDASATLLIGVNRRRMTNFGKVQIFGAKFYESGVLIRDLVPYSGTRGVGLLDRVNDVLYTNANSTGTLTYGVE